MKQLYQCVSFFILMVSAVNSYAALEIRITQSNQNAQPIAIVPFAWSGNGAAPVNVASVISNDLERSGQFKALKPEDMLSQPASGQVIRFENWRAVGVDHVVVGKLRTTGEDRFAVDFQLFDVTRGEQLLGRSFPVSAKRLRRMTHHISDLIYEELTGIKGAFNTRLAYVAVARQGRKAEYSLKVADADGFNAQTVVKSAQPILSPTWSPDGVHLAYVSFRNRQAEVFAINLKTGKEQKLPGYEGVNGAPAFSPDGKKLAMALSKKGNVDIYVLDMLSRKLSRVTRGYSIETEPTWSADGRSLLFTSSRTGGPQIYSIPVSGGRAKRISFEGKYNASASASADGRYVSMVHAQRGQYRVGVLDQKNGRFAVLTQGAQDESPSFSPNGRMIIYAAKERGRGVLSVVSTDGRTRQQLLSTDGDIREPAWSPYSKI